ncbi:MAG: DUF6247 family protein, partial [Pseudonocardia sp.]
QVVELSAVPGHPGLPGGGRWGDLYSWRSRAAMQLEAFSSRQATATATPRYGEPVTALWSFDEQPRTGDPLRSGAAPVAIRDGLLAEDRAVFDVAYQRALAAARDSLDLTELFRCLEHWRRVALLQRDPDRFVRWVQ